MSPTAPICVLSGGPCAGKTTLLEELAGRGFSVVGEAAAAVILEGRLHPSVDPLGFQHEVLRRQVLLETSAALSRAGGGPIFADRAVGDHFGYLEHFRVHRGIDLHPGEFGEELARAWDAARQRYRAVFILAQNPRFTAARYRRETAEEALAIHQAIATAYRSRHPRVIEVPWAPLDRRVELVLGALARIQGS